MARKTRLKSVNMYDRQANSLFQGYRKAKDEGDTQRAKRYYDAYTTAFGRGLDIYNNSVKDKQKQITEKYRGRVMNGELTAMQAAKAVRKETQQHMDKLYSTSRSAVDSRSKRAQGMVIG